ncbi:hypothetical protein H0H92_012408 [Tricholoma furcatifolium]|nr:hypothetical protein H0H92_012408 [Tricholoma furcatifolium]
MVNLDELSRSDIVRLLCREPDEELAEKWRARIRQKQRRVRRVKSTPKVKEHAHGRSTVGNSSSQAPEDDSGSDGNGYREPLVHFEDRDVVWWEKFSKTSCFERAKVVEKEFIERDAEGNLTDEERLGYLIQLENLKYEHMTTDDTRSDEEDVGSNEAGVLSDDEDAGSNRRGVFSDDEDPGSNRRNVLSDDEDAGSNRRNAFSDDEDSDEDIAARARALHISVNESDRDANSRTQEGSAPRNDVGWNHTIKFEERLKISKLRASLARGYYLMDFYSSENNSLILDFTLKFDLDKWGLSPSRSTAQ